MGDIATIVALGSAGMSAYGSAQQASAQNDYMKETYANQAKAVSAENRMIRDSESLEKKKAISQSQLLMSRIRATAGESGLGTGGTTEALLRQVDYDTALNLHINSRNARNQFMAAQGKIQPVQAQKFNPLMDGLAGGISGLNTGLQIELAIDALKEKE